MDTSSKDILKSDPRSEIIELIRKNDKEQLLSKAAQMHGHYCPGLALGVIAATYATQKISVHSDGLEDLLAIVETNNCFSDGIQFVTACSFGNNSLIFKDFGKIALTITKRNKKGFRVSLKADAKRYMQEISPLFSISYDKVIKKRKHSSSEIQQFKQQGTDKAFTLLNLNFNNIFNIYEIETEIPDYAPSHDSIVCQNCGESVMKSRVKEIKSRKLCIPCSNESFFQLDGSGISHIKST